MRSPVYVVAIGLLLGIIAVVIDFTWRQAAATPSYSIEVAQVVVSSPVSLTATITPSTPTVTPSPQTTEVVTIVPSLTPTAPLPTSTPSLTPVVTTTHVVQAGDTLFTIASRYGVSLDQLAAANQLDLTNFLYIGDELLIPRPDFVPLIATTAALTYTLPFTFDLPANAPTTINDVAYSEILLMTETAAAHVLEIYAHGQTLGRNPRAFAKVGDSTVENDHFLSRFDQPELGYDLGDYAYLRRVIEYYAGSFNRDSAAVRIGLHAWTMFDPQWADFDRCEPNESPIECEIRLHNPVIVLIRIGSNDVGVPDYYEQSLRQLVEYCLAQGVIPIIGTKADRNDGWSNPNNMIMRKLAAEYALPLWDYDRVADTLPGRGLDEDGIHMNVYYQHDFTDPIAYQRGHAMHNLTALVVLDLLTQLVNQ